VIQGLQRLYDTDAGGAGSFGIAVARSLGHVYVSHRDARKLTVLTKQSGQWTLLHPGPETGSKEPFELAYSPTASRLFLINYDSPNWYVDMWKVNAGSDWSFITRQDVPSGGSPVSQDVGGSGLEVSRATGKIYNLNTGADNLSILNVSGDSLYIVQTVALGDDPFAIAINNTTNTVFIGLRAPGRLVKIADQP
jgi:DNA-binding beta-propeller fold protein YncE